MTTKQADAVASTREDFLRRASAYAAAAGIKISSLSLYLFNDGQRLGEIMAGGDLRTRQLERGLKELAAREAALKVKSKTRT